MRNVKKKIYINKKRKDELDRSLFKCEEEDSLSQCLPFAIGRKPKKKATTTVASREKSLETQLPLPSFPRKFP